MTLREFHRLGKIAVFCAHRMFRANEKTDGLAFDNHAVFLSRPGMIRRKDGVCLARAQTAIAPPPFAMQLLFFRGPSVVAAASIGLTSPIRSANSFSLALLRPREYYGSGLS